MCWLSVVDLITLRAALLCTSNPCKENTSELDITAAHVLQRFILLEKYMYLLVLNRQACVDSWLSFIR